MSTASESNNLTPVSRRLFLRGLGATGLAVVGGGVGVSLLAGCQESNSPTSGTPVCVAILSFTQNGQTFFFTGAPVTLTAAGGGSFTVTPITGGQVCVTNIPPGVYTITSPGFAFNPSTITIAPGLSAVPITITAQPGTVYGIVRNQAGTPINGALVSLGSQSQLTNGDGEFVFTNVAPGTYQLSASASGYVSIAQTVNIPAAPAFFLITLQTQPVTGNTGGTGGTGGVISQF